MKKKLFYLLLILTTVFPVISQTMNWGKVTPESTIVNIDETINMEFSRLWDGKVENPWFEPIWSIPYDISNYSKENKIEKIFGKSIGTPSKEGEIIWELDGNYQIDIVKVFILNSWRCIRFEYNEDEVWHEIATIGPYGQTDKIWQRVEIDNVITDKIRITFPNGWEQARFISEIEVWGSKVSGTNKNDKYIEEELVGIYDKENETYWYTTQVTEGYGEIEVILNKEDKIPECTINGNTINLIKEKECCYKCKVEENLLRSDRQFISVKNKNIKSVYYRKVYDSGILESVNSEEIERIIVNNEDESISIIEGKGRLREDINLNIYPEDAEFIYYGSRKKDSEPFLKIYHPKEDDEKWTGHIIGIAGNSQTQVKVKDIGVSRADSIFWIPLDNIDFYKTKGKIILEAINDNQTKGYKLHIKGPKKQKGGELFNTQLLEYTNQSMYPLKGYVNDKETDIFINEEKIKKEWNDNFEYTFEPKVGYQEIRIEAVLNNQTVGYWTKELFYCGKEDLKIVIEGFEDSDAETIDIRTTKEKYTIKGYVQNAINSTVYIGEKEIKTKNNRFEIEVLLNEKENEINLRAEDEINRNAQKKIYIKKIIESENEFENTRLEEDKENNTDEETEKNDTTEIKETPDIKLKLMATRKVQDPMESIYETVGNMSLQERINAGKSYLDIEKTEENLSVSLESGSLYLENTDFVIYGKNGFEYPIKRIYDSSTAKQDTSDIGNTFSCLSNYPFDKYAFAYLLSYAGIEIDWYNLCYRQNDTKSYTKEEIDKKVYEAFLLKGGYAQGFGAGWRLNLPYIVNVPFSISDPSVPENTKKPIMIRMPSGSYYQFNMMNRSGNGYENNAVYTYENHKREDFTLLYSIKTVFGDRGQTKSSHPVSFKLITKDGISYDFNQYGQVTKIYDAAETNVITINYSNNLISNIIAPNGNIIAFEYEKNEKYIQPVISKIIFKKQNGVIVSNIQYTYDSLTNERKYYNIMRLLKSVSDQQERKTEYFYNYCSKNTLGLYTFDEDSFEQNYIAAQLRPFQFSSNYLENQNNAKEILGLETPTLLSSIRTPLGFVQQIEYSKKTAEISSDERYLPGPIPTKKSRIMVKSVKEINGALEKKTEYEYSQKLHANCQIMVANATIIEDTKKTINSYEEKKDDNTGDYTSHLKKSELVINKTVNNKTESQTISSSEYEWNENERIKKQTIKKGSGTNLTSKETSYLYDNWGNITKETVTKKSNVIGLAQTSVRTISSKYYNTSSGNITNFPAVEKNTVSQTVGATRNLLINQSIEEGDLKIYKAWAYDSYGRVVWKGIYNNSHWAAEKIEYYPKSEKDAYKRGLISKITSPTNQITEYTYTIDDNKLTLKKNIKNVNLGARITNITSSSTKELLSNKIISETDANGNVTKYEYDRLGRLTFRTSADGLKEYIYYDDLYKTIIVSRDELTINYHLTPYTTFYSVDCKIHKRLYLDTKENIIKIQYGNGSSTVLNIVSQGGRVRYPLDTEFGTEQSLFETFDYDKNDNIISYTNPNGKITKYEYDELNRVTRQINPDGSFKVNKYDYNSNYITDEAGKSYYEDYDVDGQIIQKRRYIGHQSGYEESRDVFEYDVSGKCISKKTPVGMNIKYSYSPFGLRLANYDVILGYMEEIEGEKSIRKTESVRYNDEGLVEESSEGFACDSERIGGSRFTKNIYNGRGYLLSAEKGYAFNYPGGQRTSKDEYRKTQYQYDANGNVIKEINADGTYKTYTYDCMNRIISESDEKQQITKYEYNHDGKVTKITDTLGYVYQYEYDAINRLIKAILPAVTDGGEKNIISFTYDKCGNLIKKIDGEGIVTTWEYDSGNRKIKESIKGSDGNQILKSWTYFANGKLKSETLGSLDTQKGGATTGYEYDQWNRLIKVKYSDGQSEEYECNKNDQVIKIKYADGSVKINEYNKTGFLTKETDEEGKVTEHGYNIWGEEVKRIDKNADGSGDQIWEIKYNYFGQVEEEKRNNGQVWSYKYNKRGLLEEKTDPKGILQKVIYDECGLKTKETYTHNGTSQSRSFKYDSEGNLYYASDSGITTYINYEDGKNISNAYGLILQNKTTVNGKSLTTKYDYDKGQRISKADYPDSLSVCFGYNGTGLLKEIGNEANATAYANNGNYNNAGYLKELTAGNATKLTQTIDEAKNQLTVYNWGISGKAANILEWNLRGNITGQRKNGISYSYEYDKKNQLKTERKSGTALAVWTYDSKGNRKTESRFCGAAQNLTYYSKSDLVKSDYKWKYNYDANGNMIAKGKNATAKTNGGLFEGWTFNTTAGEVWSYEYDLCNRLVKVRHSTSGTGKLSQVVEYKYDYRDLMVCRTIDTGSSSVKEYFEYDMQGKLIYTEKGTEKHDYVYANAKLWCELVTKGSTKNTYYHHTDHLGTTVCITDSTGKLIWECEKDAFGNVLSKTNANFVPNFTGKLLDPNTNLYYFNARWYDSDMGRFITEDPARDGGNWYVYCENNPLINVDLTGKFDIPHSINFAYMIVQGYMTFDTGFPLGGTHKQSSISLYQEQYTSEAEYMNNSAKTFAIASSFSKNHPLIGLALVGASIYMQNADASDTLITDPARFIAGAESEIKRLDAAIECFKNNPESNDLVDFLCNQKKQLTDEIDANKEHSKDIVYTNNYGAKINNSEIRTPHPGIDYIKAYEESKKNDNKKDE